MPRYSIAAKAPARARRRVAFVGAQIRSANIPIARRQTSVTGVVGRGRGGRRRRRERPLERFRPKLAEVVALVEAGDADALRTYQYGGFIGSSMRAILKYRDLALIALEARTAKAAA